MKKLAIVTTHPIQYYVPMFRLLAKMCELKVFYTWGEDGAKAKYDPDFKRIVAWDLPLLDGYDHEFLNNVAKDPGSHHYRGIVNPDLIAKLKQFDPHAILVYGWSYQSHLSVLRYFKNKIAIWFRGDFNLLDQTTGFKQVLRTFFLKWVYQHIDKAFYVGTANKAYYQKFGLRPTQLVFAPHAVDNDRFTPKDDSERMRLRNQLGIPVDSTLVVFAGKLESKKDPEALLTAFMGLTNNNHMHLLFVGNGELEEHLKEKSRQQSNVHFMEFQNQSQMPVIYQACDLFCLPSQGPGETWGLAINEAMATGKAILVSDKVGCAIDLVKPNVNGFIFKSGNVADLQNKLSILTSNPSLLQAMAAQSKNIIAPWSIAAQAEVILKELYSNAVS